MHCLNSYGCQNEVPPGQVFCSERCKKVYRGEIPPDYSNYQPYIGSDRDFKIVDDIFQRFFGYHKEPLKKRGVKSGTKRGKYGKPRLERKAVFDKLLQKRRLRRERNRRYYQKKKEQKRKQKIEVLRHV